MAALLAYGVGFHPELTGPREHLPERRAVRPDHEGDPRARGRRSSSTPSSGSSSTCRPRTTPSGMQPAPRLLDRARGAAPRSIPDGRRARRRRRAFQEQVPAASGRAAGRRADLRRRHAQPARSSRTCATGPRCWSRADHRRSARRKTSCSATAITSIRWTSPPRSSPAGSDGRYGTKGARCRRTETQPDAVLRRGLCQGRGSGDSRVSGGSLGTGAGGSTSINRRASSASAPKYSGRTSVGTR